MSLWANKQSWGLWSVNDRAAGFCQKDQIAVFVTLHEVSLGLDLVIFSEKSLKIAKFHFAPKHHNFAYWHSKIILTWNYSGKFEKSHRLSNDFSYYLHTIRGRP